jgi:hypothetical protein
MSAKMSRAEILRKCIYVFEGWRRFASKGGAGLEADPRSIGDYELCDQVVSGLKEMMREIEGGKQAEDVPREAGQGAPLRDWQKQIMAGGVQERMMIF